MGIFDIVLGSRKRDIVEYRFSQLNSLLKASFGNVKRDTALIFQWLNYFNQRIANQDGIIAEQNNTISGQKTVISELKDDISMLPRKEEIRQLIDDAYSNEDLVKRLDDIEKKLSKSPVSVMHPSIDTIELQKRIDQLEKKRASIKEKLVSKITRNSKEYLKSVLFSFIKKYGEISALQLKEMIVEEQGLCSKSSFYRLLQEIEDTGEVGVIKKGKEKHYMANQNKAVERH